MPGRHITDNILVAFETTFAMKKRGGNTMALKLDKAKAYDRVEWCFVQQIMECLGFAPKFISLILDCISSVSYSIICQGNISGHITPERGIRQGDPLSPYLFLLCAEGFSHLIQ